MRRSRSADALTDVARYRSQDLRLLEEALHCLDGGRSPVATRRGFSYSRCRSLEREIVELRKERPNLDAGERSPALTSPPPAATPAEPSRSPSPPPRIRSPSRSRSRSCSPGRECARTADEREEAIRRVKFSKKARTHEGGPSIHANRYLDVAINAAVKQGQMLCTTQHRDHTRQLRALAGSHVNQDARRVQFSNKLRQAARAEGQAAHEQRVMKENILREQRIDNERLQLEDRLRRERDDALLEQRLLKRDLREAKQAEYDRVVRKAYHFAQRERATSEGMTQQVTRALHARSMSVERAQRSRTPTRSPRAIPPGLYSRLLGAGRTSEEDYVAFVAQQACAEEPSLTRQYLASKSPSLARAVSLGRSPPPPRRSVSPKFGRSPQRRSASPAHRMAHRVPSRSPFRV